MYRSDPNFDSHSYTTTRIPLRRGRRGKCRNACGRRDSHAQRPMLAADASHTRGPGGTCRHARAHMRDSRRHRRERGRSGARSNGNRPAKNASRKSCGSCLTTRVGGRETCDRRVRVEGSEGCAESGRWRATRRLTRANSGAFEAHTLRARTCTPAPLPKALIGARSDERLLRQLSEVRHLRAERSLQGGPEPHLVQRCPHDLQCWAKRFGRSLQRGRKPTSERHSPAVKSACPFDQHPKRLRWSLSTY